MSSYGRYKTRCKFAAKCTRPGCRFTHPDHPDWDTAELPRERRDSGFHKATFDSNNIPLGTRGTQRTPFATSDNVSNASGTSSGRKDAARQTSDDSWDTGHIPKGLKQDSGWGISDATGTGWGLTSGVGSDNKEGGDATERKSAWGNTDWTTGSAGTSGAEAGSSGHSGWGAGSKDSGWGNTGWGTGGDAAGSSGSTAGWGIPDDSSGSATSNLDAGSKMKPQSASDVVSTSARPNPDHLPQWGVPTDGNHNDGWGTTNAAWGEAGLKQDSVNTPADSAASTLQNGPFPLHIASTPTTITTPQETSHQAPMSAPAARNDDISGLPSQRPSPIAIPLPGRKSVAEKIHGGQAHRYALKIATELPISESSPSAKSITVETPITPLTAVPKPTYAAGPEGRAALYKKLIETIQSLVSLDLDLRRAKDDVDHIEKATKSKFNEHAKLGSARQLDSHRNELRAGYRSLEKRFERELRTLVDLPSLLPTSKFMPPDKLKQEVLAYTAEVKEWAAELEAAEKKHIEEVEKRRKEREEAERIADDIDAELPSYVSRLGDDQRSFTWSKLRDVLNVLDRRICAMVEALHSDIGFSIDLQDEQFKPIVQDFSRRIEEAFQQLAIPQVPQPVHISLEIEVLQNEVDQVKRDLDLGQQEVELLQKQFALEKETVLVEEERDMLERFYADAVIQLSKFEQWEEEEFLTLEELKDEVSKLHAQQEEQQRLQDLKVLELSEQKTTFLLEKLEPLVHSIIRQELTPMLKALENQCFDAYQALHYAIDSLFQLSARATQNIITP